MDKTSIEPTNAVIAMRQRTKVARQAKRKALLEAATSDPIDWRGQHAAEIVEPTRRGSVVIRRVQSPLDWYYARKHITARQWTAGDRLRSVYELGICGVHDADQARGGSGHGGFSEAQLDAAESVRLASAAVGRHLWPVLLDVICSEYSTDQIAKRRGENSKGIVSLLRVGLDTLADHFDEPKRQRPTEARKPLTTSGPLM